MFPSARGSAAARHQESYTFQATPRHIRTQRQEDPAAPADHPLRRPSYRERGNQRFRPLSRRQARRLLNLMLSCDGSERYDQRLHDLRYRSALGAPLLELT